MQMLKSSEQQPNLTSEPQVPEKPFSQTPVVAPDKGCTTLSCGLPSPETTQNNLHKDIWEESKVSNIFFYLLHITSKTNSIYSSLV